LRFRSRPTSFIGIENLIPSDNAWDWLGDGIYFWEQNPQRALQYSIECASGQQRNKIRIKTPFVLGALIDLKTCFNLTESASISALKKGYDDYIEIASISKEPILQNVGPKRFLDCAVIKYIHKANQFLDKPLYYDTVRAAFSEGSPVYDGCEIREQTHIQISVRNEDCIKGYFLPKPFTQLNPYVSDYIKSNLPSLIK
jgi:hypothetical protein